CGPRVMTEGGATPGTTRFSACLVVEDTASTRRWLCEAAAHAFPTATVDAVGSVREAMDWLRRHAATPRAVLIVDLGLPDGSGLDIVRAASAAQGERTVVVATIFNDDEHLLSAFKAGADGYLLVSDVPGNAIHRWTKAGGGGEFLKPSGYAGPPSPMFREAGSNGLVMTRGGLVMADSGNRGIARIDMRTKAKTMLCSHFEGKRLNSPNDLWIDTAGGIYFTDPRYGNRDNMEMKEEAVYYVTADGQISRIIDDLVRPNGIALSPDGKTLYVVDNGTSLLYRYPVLGPGKLGKGERIAYTPGPDGMSVDEKGRLYVTGIEGTLVLEPDGKWIGVIASAEPPSNCTFGGKDYRTLFITARTGLYAIETQTRGWHVHLDGEAPASGQ
ncbi:MAG TPA: SMP-30/gluconolactonase/LRE family protein, partial [Phycisphaerae bacterium]|nr:SMP-30/gluconolactonase/LRE family protein [Phycisphaerae bacterium]